MEMVTTLRPGWRNKMVVIVVVLLAFGAWGFYDATIAYPKRGIRVAEKIERDYLVASRPASGNLQASSVSVPDPGVALADLRSKAGTLSARDELRFNWLDALSRAASLSEDRTVYIDGDPKRDPDARLAELDAYWSSNPGQPKPLSRYDIFIQWVICFGAWAGGLLALLMMVRVASKKYRFESDTLTLTLPTGESITPDDLEEVDKTKWSKFFVHLRIKPEHPTLGGKAIPIDLYRRGRLEDWILQMEAKAFPEPETPGADTPASDEAAAPAP